MRKMPWMACLLSAIILLHPALISAADRPDGGAPGTPGSMGNTTVVGGQDGGFYQMFQTDDQGRLYVLNKWQSEWPNPGHNLRSNQPINTEFVSQVVDVRSLGTKPTLLISFPGSIKFFVGVDFLRTGDIDSTSIIRPRLGGSDPKNLDGRGTMRMFAAQAVALDSLTTGGMLRTTYSIPLYADSAGREIGWAPFVRVHVYTDAQANGCFAHLVGRP